MGRTLTDGTHTDRRNDAWSDRTLPGKMGCGLGMAHHYRTPGAKKRHHAQAALRLPRRDLEKPKQTGSPSGETVGLPKSIKRLRKTHRETGKEQRDAPCRPCRLHHERRAWVPVGHFRLELSKPRHSGHQGNTTKPPLFLYNHFIHPYTHSFHTPTPPGRFYPNRPGARGLRHRICG